MIPDVATFSGTNIGTAHTLINDIIFIPEQEFVQNGSNLNNVKNAAVVVEIIFPAFVFMKT